MAGEKEDKKPKAAAPKASGPADLKTDSAALVSFLEGINSKFGSGTIVLPKKTRGLAEVARVPTGILSLDIAWGGGVARGRVHVLRGEYSSGKTLVMLKTVAAFQRYCRSCGNPAFKWDEIQMKRTKVNCGCPRYIPARALWVDAENVWDSQWAARMGVDLDQLFVARAEAGEDVVDIVDGGIRSGNFDIIVVDSLAALTPQEEIDGSAADKQMGAQARLIGKALRKFTAGQLAAAAHCIPTVLMSNQIRMKIGVVYGNPETSPGGKAPEFYAATMAKVKRTEIVEAANGLAVAHSMEVHFSKNKTAPPFRTAAFTIALRASKHYAFGASNYAQQLVTLGVYWKIIKQSGSWIEILGAKVQGLEKAGEFLCQPANIAFRTKLHEAILAKELHWATGGVSTGVAFEGDDGEDEDEVSEDAPDDTPPKKEVIDPETGEVL